MANIPSSPLNNSSSTPAPPPETKAKPSPAGTIQSTGTTKKLKGIHSDSTERKPLSERKVSVPPSEENTSGTQSRLQNNRQDILIQAGNISHSATSSIHEKLLVNPSESGLGQQIKDETIAFLNTLREIPGHPETITMLQAHEKQLQAALNGLKKKSSWKQAFTLSKIQNQKNLQESLLLVEQSIHQQPSVLSGRFSVSADNQAKQEALKHTKYLIQKEGKHTSIAHQFKIDFFRQQCKLYNSKGLIVLDSHKIDKEKGETQALQTAEKALRTYAGSGSEDHLYTLSALISQTAFNASQQALDTHQHKEAFGAQTDCLSMPHAEKFCEVHKNADGSLRFDYILSSKILQYVSKETGEIMVYGDAEVEIRASFTLPENGTVDDIAINSIDSSFKLSEDVKLFR